MQVMHQLAQTFTNNSLSKSSNVYMSFELSEFNSKFGTGKVSKLAPG
jgi:hypothetical protein